MGPGHFAIGFAAKPLAPQVPLWGLLAASEVLDLLCFGFLIADMEEVGVSNTDIHQGINMVSPASIPWSHGLLMSVVWSVLAALLVFLFFKSRRTSIVVGLVVLSHWVLDFIVHPPELPLLLGGSPLVGLGLWTFEPGLVISGILEVALLAGGIAIYRVSRKRAVRPIRAGGIRK